LIFDEVYVVQEAVVDGGGGVDNRRLTARGRVISVIAQ
jgi:hypothetical protein